MQFTLNNRIRIRSLFFLASAVWGTMLFVWHLYQHINSPRNAALNWAELHSCKPEVVDPDPNTTLNIERRLESCLWVSWEWQGRRCYYPPNKERKSMAVATEAAGATGGAETMGVAAAEASAAEAAEAPEAAEALHLPEAHDLLPDARALFFVEASCEGARAAVRLTPRQACAVEAAARLHPRRSVHVLVAAPEPLRARTAGWTSHVRALLAYSNVKFVRVDVELLLRGSPLEPLFSAGALMSGPRRAAHVRQVLFFLLLWRFGGTVLSFDMVLTLPLGPLTNFAFATNSEYVSLDAVSLACDALGRRVARDAARELVAAFECRDWFHNGPALLTRVLFRLCAANSTADIAPERCAGFRLLPWAFARHHPSLPPAPADPPAVAAPADADCVRRPGLRGCLRAGLRAWARALRKLLPPRRVTPPRKKPPKKAMPDYMMKEYATYFLRSIILGVKYLYFLILAILSLLTKQACALIMCVKRCWRSLCAGLVLFVLLLLPLAMSGEERSSMAPGRHCEWHGTSLDGLQLTMSNVFKCKWRKVCKGCQCYDPRKVMRLRLKAERKDAKRRPTPPTPRPTLDAEAADPKALLDAADLTPSDSSLFFVEASCASARAPLQPLQLTARQACAVESAARLHPERSVHLLVAAPRSLAADAALWSPPARALRHYPNVRVARVDVARYLRATPLAPLLSSGALARGHWPRAHAVSFIGYTTLWRFGGILLDLDFVVMKPLDGLTNFVAAETLSTLAPGALGTSCDEPGRRAATELLRSVYEDFDCGLWRDGAAVARMLDNVCNNSMEWPIEDRGCKEFQTLPPAAFFPVPWQSWQRLLLEEHAEGTMATLQGSYAVHMWEAWTAGRPVHLNSSQPYAQLARKFCPRVAKAAGPVF